MGRLGLPLTALDRGTSMCIDTPTLLRRGAVRLAALLGSAVLGAAPALVVAAEAPDLEDWQRLGEQLYRGPLSVPDGGLEWRLDTARFVLENGRLWLLEPLDSGAVTGLVFEGSGRFEMSVPDAIELRQLRRFTNDRELEVVDQPFSRAVLRVSDPDWVRELVELSARLPGDSRPSPNSTALERHRFWLLQHNHDANARVLAALRTLGDRYLRVDMKTAEWSWLTYQYDEQLGEEIDLLHYPRMGRYPVVESWLSLDRADQRKDDGRPTSEESTTSRLLHIDAELKLLDLGRKPARGFGKVHPIDAEITTTTRLQATRDGVGAFYLDLHPMARLSRVHQEGRELEVLRYPTGTLESSIDRRRANPSFVVLLERPLLRDETLELTFEYELELINFASGLEWYPRPHGIHHQPHTAELRFEHRAYYDVLAMGTKVSESETGATHTTAYRVDRPSRMIGFTFARWAHQRTFCEPGLPPVTLFGTRGGFMSAQRVEEASEHVLGSLRFYQELLDSPIQSPELVVTLIGARFGQAFEGFIHLDDYVTAKPVMGVASWGAKQLFVAHEVAHQWWGHDVGWKSYRDVWLSEATAEYSAMMYIEAELDDGEKVFRDMLRAFNNELSGSLKGLYNAFARPGAILLTKQGRDRIGPIGHGYRAMTSDTPTAYNTMAYRKGALVLHMLRIRLRAETGDDDSFIELLRELRREFSDAEVATGDLIALMAKRIDSDWPRFFDQWVFGTGIPTWVVKETIEEQPSGGARVTLEVEQLEVPSDFWAEVPVRVDHLDGTEEWHIMTVDRPLQSLELELERAPRRVVFNPEHAVIAITKRR